MKKTERKMQKERITEGKRKNVKYRERQRKRWKDI